MSKIDRPSRPAGRVLSSPFLVRVAWFARWLIGPAVTILAASAILYLAVALQPGDPATQILGDKATPAQYAALRQELGLDRPIFVQYFSWLGGALHGDFGDSLTYKQGVSGLIGPRLVTTLFLSAYAAILILIGGVALGVIGGLSRRWSTPIAALSGLGVAIPGFVAAQLLIAIFAVRLNWFPVLGPGEGLADRLNHLTLPALALAIGSAAYVAQVTRTAVTEVANRPFVETARGRGLPAKLILRKHIMRNASIPITTVAALAVAGLLAGAVVIEVAFGIGGIGSLLVQSVSAKDTNVVLAIGLILVAVFVLATTIIDVAQRLLDPRIRSHGGNR